MKLKDQVCSLELSKKLKELGVKQESLFTWKQWVYPEGEWKLELYQPPAIYKAYRYISAFTVAELGEMLPTMFKSAKSPMRHYVAYCTIAKDSKGDWLEFEDATEADARAKMLIYLLENKLVKEIT